VWCGARGLVLDDAAVMIFFLCVCFSGFGDSLIGWGVDLGLRLEAAVVVAVVVVGSPG
jgi:hypothetical protein